MATRADYAYYPKLWQKSYLIEIVEKKSQVLHRSYAFSLPPQSVTLSIPQRVSVKKTFGGSFVDDYGVDLMSISLKGTTGNGQLKEIYRTNAVEYITGRNEAYLIIQEILLYKNKLKNFENYEMRLYDLSTVSDAISDTMLSDLKSVDATGWYVVLKDGKIEQSKDKPFFYDYNLDFTILQPIGIKSVSTATQYTLSKIEKIFAAIDDMKKALSGVQQILAAYRSFVDKIKLAREILDNLESVGKSYFQTAQGFIDTTASGTSSVFDLVTFPMDMTIDLMNATVDIREAFEGVFDQWKDGVTSLETKPEKIAELIREIANVENLSSTIRMEAKSPGAIPDVHVVPLSYPGVTVARDANDHDKELDIGIILTFGFVTKTATGQTRLDVVARTEYGDADYADIIAKYNGFTVDTVIPPGTQIKLPMLKYSALLRDSQVYSSGREIYGTDIALAFDGDVILAESNDFTIVTGINNMIQAITLRVSEDSGARIRIDVYGIKQSKGSFDPFSFAILIMSIKNTLVQDPRIQSASNFRLIQSGDVVVLKYDIQLETGITVSSTFDL